MLNTPLNETIFTSIDLETTGLHTLKDEIIEIGAVKFNKSGNLETLNLMVKPKKGLKRIAQSINGIHESDLINAIELDAAMVQLINFIKGTVLIFHNSVFDMAFLEIASRRLKLTFPELPVYCTVHLSRKAYPEYKKYNLIFLRDKMKIETIYKYRDANFHEALDDANATAVVFLNCVEKIGIWNKTPKETIAHSMGLRTSADYNRILMKKVV